MSNLIPFDSAKLPASIAKAFSISFDDFSTGQKGGFPVISIKGKVFHIKRGDEKTLVTKPDGDGEPAASLEVIVLKTHPGVAKTYYSKGFSEGSVEKPDCYSNDGAAPAADAQSPQAKKCAACPHNQWGSKITEDGKKGKSCADVKRLAVAPAGQINDPMLLRVPAASLKTWDQYVDLLKKRGVPPPAVVTKVGFDYTVAHPALTFKPVGFIDEAMAVEVKEVLDTDVVQNIIGGAPTAAEVDNGDDAPKAAAKPAPVEEEAPAPAPKKSAKLAAVVEEAEAAPKAKVKVEAEAEEEAPAPAPKKAAKVVEVDDDITAGLDDMLSDLGFDDEE
jgi:hypothetical protein